MLKKSGKKRSTRNASAGTGRRARLVKPVEAEMLPTATTTEAKTVAENAPMPPLASRVLTAVELEVLRLVNVQRVDVREVADVMNRVEAEVPGKRAKWTVERVVRVVERARTKLTRQGEFEAARPNAYAAHETRVRYDDIIRRMYDELDNLVGPEFASARVKMLSTIATVERLRDESVRAFSPTRTENAHVMYVSHLRGDAPNAGARTQGS